MTEKLRTHRQALPRGVDALLRLFKRAIQLSAVEEIKVTPEVFSVTRVMDEADPGEVFPKESADDDADPLYLLSKVELENAPFDPEQHPFLALVAATRALGKTSSRVAAILAPDDGSFAAYFGLEADERPELFLGMRVIYNQDEKYSDKLVVLGGPTAYLADVTNGVIIDMGV